MGITLYLIVRLVRRINPIQKTKIINQTKMSQAAAPVPVPAAAPAPTVPSQSAAPKKATAAKKVAAKKRAASPKKKATTQIAKIPAERTGKTAQIIAIVQANAGRKGISARAIIKELGPQTPVQANATKRLIKSLVDKQILTPAPTVPSQS